MPLPGPFTYQDHDAVECVPIPYDQDAFSRSGRLRCPVCREAIGVHQPDADLPGRLLGTCGDCRAWFLIDREAGVMLLLPDTTARGD